MSILTTELPTNRLNVDGLTVNKKEKLAILRDWFKTGTYSRKDAGKKLGIRPEKAYTDYMILLLNDGSIKKIENTQKYTAVERQVTKQDLREELYDQSDIMNTQLFQRWKKNNSSKKVARQWTRFARICLGQVNPKFKIHPDSIDKDNWETVVNNMVDAILEATREPKLHWGDKQTIRHAIMYGLEITISQEKGDRLRIDGDKDKPKSAHLRIERKQYDAAKEFLKSTPYGIKELVKFGFKVWTFVRPSIIYTIRTDEPIFYDREIKYVLHSNNKIQKKQEVIEFAEQLLLIKPELSEHFKVITETKRACRLEAVHEFKTDSDFNKFIFDEEIVIALEKYVKQRKFEKKKYLFWNDNNTKFIFETYDDIVKHRVVEDNKYFKVVLSHVGFKREDFGFYFRANYGFRHFGIQMWLEETDYDYDFVQTMSHEDGTTLKQWYGKQSAQYQEKRTREVHF